MVEVRSYSRISGLTSELSDTGTPGHAVSKWSRMRRSCAVLALAFSSTTATVSAPSALTCCATCSSAARVSATATVPSALTRSAISNRRSRGISGGSLWGRRP